MTTPLARAVCDRCGHTAFYIQIRANNGMVAYQWDLCQPCFKDIQEMMLNFYRSRAQTCPSSS